MECGERAFVKLWKVLLRVNRFAVEQRAKALMIAISSANVVCESTAFHRLDPLQGSNQCSIAPLA